MMYYNVSTLMGLTNNTDSQIYVKEKQEENSEDIKKRKILLDGLVQKFQNFYNSHFSVMIYDFVVANYEVGYFCSIIIEIYSTNLGYEFYINLEPQNIYILKTINDYIRSVIEIIYLTITVFLLIHIFIYDYTYAKMLAIAHDYNDFIIKMGTANPNTMGKEYMIENPLDIISDDQNEDNNRIINNVKAERFGKDSGNKNLNIIRKSIQPSKTFNNWSVEKKKHTEILAQNWICSDLIKYYIKLYFSDLLDVIRNVSLLLSLIMMIYWITYVTYIISNDNIFQKTTSTYNVVLDFDFSNSLINVSRQFKIYIRIMAVAGFFVCIRLLKIFELIFPTLTVYLIGLRKSLSDILSFFMLFFLIIFGISLILYFYYSITISKFNTLTFSFLNNLYFFIGSTDNELVTEMYEKSNAVTIIYFLVITLLIKYSFVRILLAIILYNFDGLKHSKGNRYKCVSVKVFKETEKREFFYGIYRELKSIPKQILNFIQCKKNKKNKNKKFETTKNSLNKINKQEDIVKDYNQEKNVELAIKNKEFKENSINKNQNSIYHADSDKNMNYKAKTDVKGGENNAPKILMDQKDLLGIKDKILNLDDLRFVYSKYIENFEMISRNPYFDSTEDISRVNLYYEKKYETNFKRNMMYILLILFLILSIFFNTNSPWRFLFKSLFLNGLYSKEYTDISYINSRKQIDKLFLNDLPSLFKKLNKSSIDYFYLDSNIILGNRFFLTKKRQRYMPEDNNYFEGTREFESIDIEKDFAYENKSDVTFPYNKLVTKFVYDKEKNSSYQSIGGLVSEIDLSIFEKLYYTSKSINDTITDEYDDFNIIEFMILNIEINIFAKYTFFSVQDYGYFFYNKYQVDILSGSFTSNIFQLYRFVFIAILFVLLIYETREFRKEIKQLNNSYDHWFLKTKVKATPQAKAARKFINSEFARKLRIIFNPIRGLMLLILVCIYIYIILFFYSIFLEGTFYNYYDKYKSNLGFLQNLPKNATNIQSNNDVIYKLKDQFTIISRFRDSYDKLSAIILFFASLRIMFSLNIGKYFNSISQIAMKTLTKNLVIVLLLFLVLPSFIFFSYLIFGVYDQDYRSFIDSILGNFLKLFDLKNDLSDEIDPNMRVFYVILFGIIMNLIILNLFVSIINNSYQKVKTNIFYSSENFSWIKVIFFCFNKKKTTNRVVGKDIIEKEIENFINTHEAEPMVELNKLFKNYQDFANSEVEKLKNVNETLSWIDNRTDLMEFALISKNNMKSINTLTDNRFKNVDEDLMNLQYFANISYKMQLINSLEKDILDIKESSYKLSVYLLSQKTHDNPDNENNGNENQVKQILNLEQQYNELISDIERLRKIKHEIEENNDEEINANDNLNNEY